MLNSLSLQSGERRPYIQRVLSRVVLGRRRLGMPPCSERPLIYGGIADTIGSGPRINKSGMYGEYVWRSLVLIPGLVYPFCPSYPRGCVARLNGAASAGRVSHLPEVQGLWAKTSMRATRFTSPLPKFPAHGLPQHRLLRLQVCGLGLLVSNPSLGMGWAPIVV